MWVNYNEYAKRFDVRSPERMSLHSLSHAHLKRGKYDIFKIVDGVKYINTEAYESRPTVAPSKELVEEGERLYYELMEIYGNESKLSRVLAEHSNKSKHAWLSYLRQSFMKGSNLPLFIEACKKVPR